MFVRQTNTGVLQRGRAGDNTCHTNIWNGQTEEPTRRNCFSFPFLIQRARVQDVHMSLLDVDHGEKCSIVETSILQNILETNLRYTRVIFVWVPSSSVLLVKEETMCYPRGSDPRGTELRSSAPADRASINSVDWGNDQKGVSRNNKIIIQKLVIHE